MDGVVAVADSQHRDRWGLDGYHADYVRDGNAEGTGSEARTASWASDNWEVTHAVALVFPRRVSTGQVTIHWPKPRRVWLTPRQYRIDVLRDGWTTVVEAQDEHNRAASTHTFPPVPADAIRVVMPPEGANPAADRRLWIAEIEVGGAPAGPERRNEAAAIAETIAKQFRERRQQEDAERVAPLLTVATRYPKRRGFMAIIDHDDLERGRQNMATRKWARSFADQVTKDADWWVAQTDDFIYGLIPEGNPRAICPQFEKGCPIHGGARSSFTATLEVPYRWRCKKGGEHWYDGAVVENPGTGEPVTVRDDGRGWVAPPGFPNAGRRYFFVAAYRYFLLGTLFARPYEGDGGSLYRGGTPVVQLALAYALTGDERYAHKCAVMLNRLAEVYRTYDGCVEGPTQRQDGYIGQTFERFLVQNLILACDLIWDTVESDDALHHFFALKGDTDYNRDGEAAGSDFTHNLQRNLLGYIYEYLHRLMPYLDGDFLMYEMTALAALASCLGNPDIAAETMESDLGLRVLLNNSWFRDGKYIYDASGYNVGNARTPLKIAEWLHGFCAAPRYPEPVDLYHHPDYRMAMLIDFLRRIDCDGSLPQIGDCGGDRACRLRERPPYDRHDERALVRLPELREFYRSRLSAATGGDFETHRDGRADQWLVFHAGREQTGATPGPPDSPLESHLFPDSGLTILRAGREARTRQHVCLTFSKGGYGHGHKDKLAINILRYGYDLSADLGYPGTWTDIKCGGWVKDTASHCTVMLNERPQRGNVVGRLHFFAEQPLFDVVEASAERAYPQASLYRRTVAIVRDDEGDPLYTVDIFRVAGASTRDYLFHSLGRLDDFTVTGDGGELAWVKQPKGSLAGEDVEPMTKGGYGFLSDVERARTDGGVTARWLSGPGRSQPDRYLLTRRRFRDCVVEFAMTRTGDTSGKRERAGFVFGVDPGNQHHRRFAWLDAGGKLPIGKPIRVRIEVAGKFGKVFMDGKLMSRGIDVCGTPLDEGVVGFLHYYNYAYDYRDFVLKPEGEAAIRMDFSKALDSEIWGKIDRTYSAGNGALQVRDGEIIGLDLRLVGAPGREIIRAKGEGYGLRGRSPMEGHFIARDRVADLSSLSTFVAVIEAHQGQSRVMSVDAVSLPDDASGTVAIRVVTPSRTDYVLSAMDATTLRTAEIEDARVPFRGRFGFVSTPRGDGARLGLVGAGSIQYRDGHLGSPGDVRGTTAAIDLEGDALIAELDPDSPTPGNDIIGRHLLVHNPAFICPAVYEITGVSRQADGNWRFGLNMPLAVARGTVRSVDRRKGAFATRTPVMKLRVNRGLFDGKRVRVQSRSDRPAHVLKTATESAFVLADSSALEDFHPGGEYIVYDVGVGDRVEVVASRCQ